MFNNILRTTIIGILLVGAYVFAVSEGYINISKDDKEIMQSIKDMETKITSLEKLSGKSELNSEISDLKNEVENVTSNFKVEIPISKILSNFSEISKDSGLQMLLFEPQKMLGENAYYEIPVKIKLRGTFRQQVIFCIKYLNYLIQLLLANLQLME